MTHWNTRRKASFFVHTYIVAIPFGLSTGAALTFWHDMFGRWLLAALMVASIEVLAFVGLALHIARIKSPFQALRHLLPFISIVPLGRELFLILKRNNPDAPLLAWVLAIVTTAILVVIAWQCYKTIEELFISPNEAARERAQEQMEGLRRTLATLQVYEQAADAFAQERASYRNPLVGMVDDEPQAPLQIATQAQPALPMAQATATITASVQPKKAQPLGGSKLAGVDVAALLRKHGGNATRAAQEVGVSRQAIVNWTKRNEVQG